MKPELRARLLAAIDKSASGKSEPASDRDASVTTNTLPMLPPPLPLLPPMLPSDTSRNANNINDVTAVTTVTTIFRRGREETAETSDLSEIEAYAEERAGLASDSVPQVYLDIWARLNAQQPYGVTEAVWQRALNDGGVFLDRWGDRAAELRWSADDFLGLCWRLAGQEVEELTAEHAVTNLGWVIKRRIP